MNFRLQDTDNYTVLDPELLEIYQLLMGFEAMAVWINLYHALMNSQSVLESDMIQRMNITFKQFRAALEELARLGLVADNGEGICSVLMPLTPEQLYQSDAIPDEDKRRLRPLVEAFYLKRGGLEKKSADRKEKKEPRVPGISEQQADELTTRFINECKFRPTKRLRERFDLWFEQISDIRLLEELLVRTKKKIAMEGTGGTCPSAYTDSIVRQWLIQGIHSYEDLLRHDKLYHEKQEYHRMVEKELGRAYNTLTPAEKEIVDNWSQKWSSPEELKQESKKAILSGDFQGRGVPGVMFIDKWLLGKSAGKTKKDKGYTHEHKTSDLRQAIKRKTVSFGDGEDEQ